MMRVGRENRQNSLLSFAAQTCIRGEFNIPGEMRTVSLRTKTAPGLPGTVFREIPIAL